jgi:N-acetyl-gamma-glutamyl-phosphate reductase
MLRIGIIGAKAYTAGELIRLIDGHPEATVASLAARLDAPADVADYHPALRGRCAVPLRPIDVDRVAEESDFVFLTMPHTAGAAYAKELLARGKRVADLSADFRFRNLTTYEETYGVRHPAPELNDEAPFGLPELFREELRDKRLVAVPGCYVTSVLLALAPLIGEDWIDRRSLIADAKSGVSGAGRSLSETAHFAECNESLSAYKVGVHRHQPEIEENLSTLAGDAIRLLFVPHLAPMTRGILSTVYIRLKEEQAVEEIHELYATRYRNEPFVRLLPLGILPRTRDTALTNFCDLGLSVDARTQRLVVLSALDNLVKGAAGQAVQVMNLMLGLEETAGLL